MRKYIKYISIGKSAAPKYEKGKDDAYPPYRVTFPSFLNSWKIDRIQINTQHINNNRASSRIVANKLSPYLVLPCANIFSYVTSRMFHSLYPKNETYDSTESASRLTPEWNKDESGEVLTVTWLWFAFLNNFPTLSCIEFGLSPIHTRITVYGQVVVYLRQLVQVKNICSFMNACKCHAAN